MGIFMADRRFNLLFSGQILSDFDIAVVKQNLVTQLKLTEDRVEKLFSGRLLTIKKNMSEADALRFQELFATAGAKALLKDVTNVAPAPGADKPAAKVAPATATSTSTSASPAPGADKPATKVAPAASPAPVIATPVNKAKSQTTVPPVEAVASVAEPEPAVKKPISAASSGVSCPRCGHQQVVSEDNCSHCKMDLRPHLLRLKKRQRIKQKLSV
jgi:hypothetical protein